jgi:hypothetical protein
VLDVADFERALDIVDVVARQHFNSPHVSNVLRYLRLASERSRALGVSLHFKDD